jgi:hypothetical protein
MTGFQELSKEPHRSKAVPRRLSHNLKHSRWLVMLCRRLRARLCYGF